MLSLPDDWNYSVSGLVSLSKDGKDGVMTALAELEKFGYLERERLVNEKGQFSGIEYNIYEEPQREKPIAEKPILGKQNAEKPIAEKARLLNTNSIKYLLNKICIILNTNDGELLELYQEYIKAREKMGAPLTEVGLVKLVERAKRLSKDNIRVEKVILESAIINNWKNIYLPRESELQAVKQEIHSDMRSLLGLE